MTEKRRRYRPPGRPRCTGKRKDGSACQAFVHPKAPDERCARHTQDPVLVAKQHAIAVAGGKGQGKLARALKVVDAGGYRELVGSLAQGMDDVLNGRLDPARLSAVAQTARAIVAIADQVQTKARLDRLEQRFREYDAVDVTPRHDVVVYDADGNPVPDAEASTDGDPPWVRHRKTNVR